MENEDKIKFVKKMNNPDYNARIIDVAINARKSMENMIKIILEIEKSYSDKNFEKMYDEINKVNDLFDILANS